MKRLFFAALVAVVAVGGALTSNATIYYRANNGTQPVDCKVQDAASCTDFSVLYNISGTTISPSAYATLQYVL